MFQCLTPTGGRLREKLIRQIKVKNQDGSPQYPSFSENKKISEDKETFRRESPSHNLVPESSLRIRSHSDFEKNQSRKFAGNELQIRESQSVNIDGQSITIPKENFKNASSSSPLSKNSKMCICQCQPTETKKNSRQDLKKKNSQFSVKFEAPVTNARQKTTNMGTMTEPQDIQSFDSKLKSKIKKSKWKKNKNELEKNISIQNFRRVRSCTCGFKKSNSNLDPRNAASLKNVKSNSITKFSRDSKHRLASKVSWISKTVRRLSFRNERREKLRCGCPVADGKIRKLSKTNVP